MSIPTSIISTLSEEEQEQYQKRLNDKSKPYYYGYDIEKEANEIVYPILADKPVTLNEARGRGLLIYPKRNVYLMQKLQKMVVGLEGGSIPLSWSGIKPLTEANSDEFTINYILEDLEKEKVVVKVYDYKLVEPAWNAPDWEEPHREYNYSKFKWYTRERAEADGVLEINAGIAVKSSPQNTT